MILDPFGDLLAECRELGDGFASANITREKLARAGGTRYKNARRPALYKDILGKQHFSQQHVAWLEK